LLGENPDALVFMDVSLDFAFFADHDGVERAGLDAGAAEGAFVCVDGSQLVLYPDGVIGAGFYASSTAHATLVYYFDHLQSPKCLWVLDAVFLSRRFLPAR
jgi:hypothetical protein